MSENPSKPSQKRTLTVRIVLLVIILGGAIFGLNVFLHSLSYESTDNAQIESTITPVLARVAGYVKQVKVKDYDKVKKGDTLVIIDGSEYQLSIDQQNADIAQSQADIDNAQASIDNAMDGVATANSELSLAQINKDKAEADYLRDQKLFADKAITKKQLADTKATFDEASQRVLTAKTNVSSAQSRVTVTQAAFKRAQSVIAYKKTLLQQQDLRLSYTYIIATADGEIGKRNVNEGQYVQPGQALMNIVNKNEFWVVANFKETQLDHMKLGQDVSISVDAYPEMKLKGSVKEISLATGARFSLLPPDNASGNFIKVTQRVPVKISIDNIEEYRSQLRAGLSVDAEVKVK